MEKKKWDEIPSLDGLGVDWEYVPENPHGRRAAKRIPEKDLAKLFGVQQILVKIALQGVHYTGVLRDISENGLAVQLAQALLEGAEIKVGLFLGRERIVSNARVVHVRPDAGGFITGLQFLGLPAASKQYIAGLFAALVLSHAL